MAASRKTSAAQKPAARGQAPQKPAAQKPAARGQAPQKAAAHKPAARGKAARKPAVQKTAARGEGPQKPAARAKVAQKPAARRKTVRKPAREAAGKRLAPYEEKRDFTQTPEPPGKPGQRTRTQSAGPGGKAGGPRFVVQRHRARRLHYDLRFEIDGVLVSWAVPKGPTLDPDVRHAAIHVEDHPIEYLDFEGVIPSGQYGGGDVIVWDTGTWEPHATDDPAAAVAAGDFHADLDGQKLRGRFILVRRGGPDRSGKEQWLLLHKHDEYAVKGWNPEDHPESVLSGRTNDEVKAAPDRMWRSDLPPAKASVAVNPRNWDAPSGGELAALDALGSGGTWDVFGRRLRLTNLDKELFPARPGEQPVTKREFIAYAARIAPVILPYLAGRAAEHEPLPERGGRPGLLAQAVARARARLAAALAQSRRQRGPDDHLSGGG